jgi:hypothetical protein
MARTNFGRGCLGVLSGFLMGHRSASANSSVVPDIALLAELAGVRLSRQIFAPCITKGFFSTWRKLFGLGLKPDSSSGERCSQKT